MPVVEQARVGERLLPRSLPPVNLARRKDIRRQTHPMWFLVPAFAILLATGVVGPVLVKQILFRRVPWLDRITT